MCQTSPQDVAMGIHWLQDFGTPGHQGCPIFMASWVDFPAIQAQLLSLLKVITVTAVSFPNMDYLRVKLQNCPQKKGDFNGFHDLPITTRDPPEAAGILESREVLLLVLQCVSTRSTSSVPLRPRPPKEASPGGAQVHPARNRGKNRKKNLED